MFEGDHYLVGIGGDVALAAFSGLLVFAAIASVRLARRRVRLSIAAPAIGFVFWWLFVWLSPQVYYLLYMLMNDVLPLRLVIDWPPGAERIGELLLFRGRQSAADTALGALGWSMMLASLPRA